jgi:hypothetical protein
VGVPAVVSLARAWAVAWQDDVDGGNVWLATVTDDSVTQPLLVAEGARLLGATVCLPTVNVTWVSGDLSSLGTTSVAFIWIPEPVTPLPVATWRTQVPILGTLGPAASAAGEAGATRAAATLALHDGARPDGSAYALVTWWPAPQELRYVELDEDGMVLPVVSIDAHGNAPYSPALVSQADHAVRTR